MPSSITMPELSSCGTIRCTRAIRLFSEAEGGGDMGGDMGDDEATLSRIPYTVYTTRSAGHLGFAVLWLKSKYCFQDKMS